VDAGNPVISRSAGGPCNADLAPQLAVIPQGHYQGCA
jgi:hypothetical protein